MKNKRFECFGRKIEKYFNLKCGNKIFEYFDKKKNVECFNSIPTIIS